jgi:hypothetical protein
MRHRKPFDRRCSYIVVLDGGWRGDLREFADYLSTLGVAKCEVVVVDDSPEHTFARHRRVLCWVARHVAARPRHRGVDGAVEPLRAALDLASCDKVVVAAPTVRYDAVALEEVSALLDYHEAVEPQDYLEPLPWWGAIDAGRMLVHRGIESLPDHGATFAFRKSAIRGIPAVDCVGAPGVFVRRLPPQLAEWLSERPRQAGADFQLPAKSAFFLALLPLALVLAAFGGAQLAGGYAGAVAMGAMALAVRGRLGAATVFPLRACLCAPLWVLERSVSVYWALIVKLRSYQFPVAGAPTGNSQLATGNATAATSTSARCDPR